MAQKAIGILTSGMVGARGETCKAAPLAKVAGRRKTVPLGRAWIRSARLVGTCFGD